MRMARNIYHRKDGRFEGRYAKGYDENGKKKYGSVFGRSYAEVKDKLASVAPHTDITFASNVSTETVVGAVSAHLKSLKRQIKPSTRATYQRYLDNRIVPYFGNTRCDRLTAEMLQDFINTQAESGLAAVTVQSVFFLESGLEVGRLYCVCRQTTENTEVYGRVSESVDLIIYM